VRRFIDFVPNGFNSLTYFQEDKIDINKILSKLPDNPTIIFVKNKMKQSYQLEKNILLFYLIEVLKINQIIEVSLIYKVFQEEVTDIINMTL
jgi:ABC-type phosphate transport system ATPase subunit